LLRSAGKARFEGDQSAPRVKRPFAHLPVRFSQPDFRRIIELAHAQSPRETEIALTYLGYGLVAGELRDQASLAEQALFPDA
jgi:hypothetical protein